MNDVLRWAVMGAIVAGSIVASAVSGRRAAERHREMLRASWLGFPWTALVLVPATSYCLSYTSVNPGHPWLGSARFTEQGQLLTCFTLAVWAISVVIHIAFQLRAEKSLSSDTTARNGVLNRPRNA